MQNARSTHQTRHGYVFKPIIAESHDILLCISHRSPELALIQQPQIARARPCLVQRRIVLPDGGLDTSLAFAVTLSRERVCGKS